MHVDRSAATIGAFASRLRSIDDVAHLFPGRMRRDRACAARDLICPLTPQVSPNAA